MKRLVLAFILVLSISSSANAGFGDALRRFFSRRSNYRTPVKGPEKPKLPPEKTPAPIEMPPAPTEAPPVLQESFVKPNLMPKSPPPPSPKKTKEEPPVVAPIPNPIVIPIPLVKRPFSLVPIFQK